MFVPLISLECHALFVPAPTGFLGWLAVSRDDVWLGRASYSGTTIVVVQVAVLSLWLFGHRHEPRPPWLERLRTRTTPSQGGTTDGR